MEYSSAPVFGLQHDLDNQYFLTNPVTTEHLGGIAIMTFGADYVEINTAPMQLWVSRSVVEWLGSDEGSSQRGDIAKGARFLQEYFALLPDHDAIREVAHTDGTIVGYSDGARFHGNKKLSA